MARSDRVFVGERGVIIVRVELWSAVTGQVSELARMSIDNIGGDIRHGDYRVRTLRGRSKEALDKALISNNVQREGKVIRHARLSEHVWNLVAKALANTGYGERKKKEAA